MKFKGFIGGSFELDSSNVDAQRCVNLYPEIIESGSGKGDQVAYLRGTPGLEKLLEVGTGPIRCLHVDSIGRLLAVSGAQIFSVSRLPQWRLRFDIVPPAAKTFGSGDVNDTSNQITITAHGYITGLKVRFSASGGPIIPSPLAAGVDYFVIRIDANTIKVAVSLENALSNTAIDLTNQGTASPFNITPQSMPPILNVAFDDIDFAAASFTRTAHDLISGMAVKFSATAAYPVGISPDTTYYAIVSTPNVFKLATSFANALAGTALSFTSPASSLFAKLLGSKGEYGGEPISLATASGPVKAASMSAGGNGTDSSTIFVDGANNYLLEDLEGDQELGVLGAVTYARAVVDVLSDITISTLGDIDTHVLSSGITVSQEVSSDSQKVGLNGENVIGISLVKDVVDSTGATSYKLRIARGAQAYAAAVLDITNDISVLRYELNYSDDVNEVDEHVASTGITVRFINSPGDIGGFYTIDFYDDAFGKTGNHYYRMDVYYNTGNQLTTAELVAALASGAFEISGKYFDYSSRSSPPAGWTRTQMVATNYTWLGGGSQTVQSAFGTPVSSTFTKQNGPPTSLTTGELVTAMTTGYLSGRTLIFDNWAYPFGPPAGTTRTELSRSAYTFEGGSSEDVSSAFASPITATFARVTDEGDGFGSVPGATHVVWSDGYFIVNESGTNKFWVSDLQGFTIDALSFASAEGSPDLALAVEVLNRYLYVFNEKTTEVYANTGNADFPFERISGGFIEFGCLAGYSVAKVGTAICWLGRTEDGDGSVFAIEGLQPRRISNYALDQAIRGYANPQNAVAYTYQSAGHAFYVLNFEEATWVYDFATQLWHERAYTNAGTLERHRADYCAFTPDDRLHVVGDYETNEVYSLTESKYTDDGDAITRLRAFPYISNGRKRLFFNSLLLDMETGIGLDGGVQGSNPQVMLDWSNDNGHTWSSESWALADAGSGTIGNFLKRVIWNRLGSAFSRVFRVKITDPVKVRLIDVEIEVEGGNS